MRITLGAGDVHVRYRLTDRVSAEQHAAAFALLSPDERERAERFVFDRDRVIYVAAHALVREALSGYENLAPASWTFESNAYGKPALGGRHRGIDIEFNLAHTHGLVACAFCRGAGVGIDVESLDFRVHSLDLAARYFSPAEAAGLRACAEHERGARFIELWTLKEAYVKAVGQGLSHPLNTFSVLFDDPSSIRFEPPERDQQQAWQFALFAPSTLHRMAVAVRCSRENPRHITARTDGNALLQPDKMSRR